MKRRALSMLILLLAGGCAGYTRSKIELVDQARRGVQLVRESVDARRTTLDALAERQRAQLDAAFDADARSNAVAHDASWVIAARKGYAIGLDALREQAKLSDVADAATRANLDALDAALAQLQRMHEAELQLSLPEVRR